MKKNKQQYLKTMIVGLMLATVVILLNWNREQVFLRRLCDAFFVAGGLILCTGGLKFARNGGTFDMMAFGINSVLKVAMPWTKVNSPLEHKDEDFVAYKERKQAKRTPCTNLVVVGLIYLAVAFILLGIYWMVHK